MSTAVRDAPGRREARAGAAALLGPAPLDDPGAAAAAVRAFAPVLDLGAVVLVTGHAAAQRALAEPALRHEDADHLSQELPGWAEHPALRSLMREMVNSNGSEHRARRSPFAPAFSVRRVRAAGPAIEESADRVVTRIVGRPGTVVDAAEEVRALPLDVIGSLVGVDRAEGPWFRARVEAMTATIGEDFAPPGLGRADRAVVEMRDRLDRLVAERTGRPGDDLVTALVASGLPSEDLLANLILLWSAGYETTANLLGSAVWTLLTDTATADLLRGGPDLVPGFVDELLRLETPVPMTTRVAAEDVELDGTAIRAGARVVVHLAAAHRDPLVFPEPDRCLPDRDASGLAFGAGPHHCLGAGLARLEVAAFVRRLLPHLDDLALAGPHERATGPMRGLHRLPVRHRTDRHRGRPPIPGGDP